MSLEGCPHGPSYGGSDRAPCALCEAERLEAGTRENVVRMSMEDLHRETGFSKRLEDERPLNALGDEIIEINTANGWNVTIPQDWNDTYKVPAILALVHSEVSEALEGFRINDEVNFAEELADILIRVLDCARGLGFDMDKEVRRKLDKNRTRGFRHGGKKL